jgi:hypothetical protein
VISKESNIESSIKGIDPIQKFIGSIKSSNVINCYSSDVINCYSTFYGHAMKAHVRNFLKHIILQFRHILKGTGIEMIE